MITDEELKNLKLESDIWILNKENGFYNCIKGKVYDFTFFKIRVDIGINYFGIKDGHLIWYSKHSGIFTNKNKAIKEAVSFNIGKINEIQKINREILSMK